MLISLYKGFYKQIVTTHSYVMVCIGTLLHKTLLQSST